MNKAGLISKMAEKSNLTRKQSEEALNTLMDIIAETLKEKEKISLVGFGTFEAKERKAREGRNPRNPEEVIQIKESLMPSFKAGKNFREKVNN